MKTISTIVKTGDEFIRNGINYRVGTYRKFDGKGLITLHIEINATSGYTRQVSTKELNKLLAL